MIPLYVWLPASLLSAFYAGMLALALCTAGRRPRRPGYIRLSPSASGSANPTTAPTRPRTATSTGCKTAGPQPADTASQATPHAPSRTTAPGGSGNATASNRGGPTTDADTLTEAVERWKLAAIATAQSGVTRLTGDLQPPVTGAGLFNDPPKAHRTGWRFVRGTHAGTYIADPKGCDVPPPGYGTSG